MFDVAVSCKNLLRDLLSCSSQDQIVREDSSETAESSGNNTEADNLPQSEKNPAEEKTDTFVIVSLLVLYQSCSEQNFSIHACDCI